MKSVIKDYKIVDECRRDAMSVALEIQKLIDAHTTSSVERTTLRFMDVDGVDDSGVPLANVLVDRAIKSGYADKGIVRLIAAYYQDEELENINEAVNELLFAQNANFEKLYNTELNKKTLSDFNKFFEEKYNNLKKIKEKKINKKQKQQVKKDVNHLKEKDTQKTVLTNTVNKTKNKKDIKSIKKDKTTSNKKVTKTSSEKKKIHKNKKITKTKNKKQKTKKIVKKKPPFINKYKKMGFEELLLTIKIEWNELKKSGNLKKVSNVLIDKAKQVKNIDMYFFEKDIKKYDKKLYYEIVDNFIDKR